MNSAPVKINPFPGLRPFTPDEDYLFFGREEQTMELLQRLGSNRFVAVVGSSGSGKSSLVRCGLLSELLGGRMLGAGAAWEVAVMHPGGNPLALLTEALLEADLYDREGDNSRENLLATLSRSHFGLVEAVKQADLTEGTNFLLVVDQFEEIFRYNEAGQQQQEAANEFVSLLLEAAAQKETPIYVVLTMRSDFIGECAQFEGLAERVNRGEFLIPRMTREQFKRVIEGPIKVAGGQIAPRLLQRLLNDLGQQADQLPCLQHALMRTWDIWAGKGDAEVLDLDDYQRVGKMSQALSLHADEIYESLASDRQRELCQGIFQSLTVEESNSRGIRRPQRLGRLCQILDVSTDELRPIIDAYRQRGVTFLMPSCEVELIDQTIIDISHESLMRVWNRLREWVEEETQAAGIYHRLSESADLHERGMAGLYRDPELGIALAWREAKRPNAAWGERYRPGFAAAMNFIEASQQASVAEEQSREGAQQRELKQAQQLAESQQLRLEQHQQASRKLQKLMVGVAVVAVIAGISCIAALVARNEAGKLAQLARTNEEQAKANEQLAEQSQQETAKALALVESQKTEVEGSLFKAQKAEEAGRKLLYTTDMKLAPFVWRDDRTTAEQLRVLLAKHIPDHLAIPNSGAIATVDKPDLRGFEWHYYQNLLEHSSAAFLGSEDSVASAAFASDNHLVTLDQNGQVRRWDRDSLQEEVASRIDLSGAPNARLRALSSDGRLAALAIGDKVHIFDTTSGKATHQFYFGEHFFHGLVFSPHNNTLVIFDNKIRWCNAETGELIASFEFDPSFARSVAVSSDGLTAGVVGHDQFGERCSFFRLDAAAKTVMPLAKDMYLGGTWRASALSSDGKWAAIAPLLSGSLFVWDTATGNNIGGHRNAHSSPITAIAFSSDGKLATADTEGTIKIWADAQKLNSKMTAWLTLKGHQGVINSVRFSSDDKWLVTTSADKTARVWDLANAGATIRPLERLANSYSHLSRFSNDGQLVAVADGGNSIRLWDAATATLVRELLADGEGRAYSVAFSPTDDRLLAVGFGGGTGVSYVALWDIGNGTELARLPGATDLPNFTMNSMNEEVGGLVFSPDGKYLVAGFGSRRLFPDGVFPIPLKVWEVSTRRLIRRLNGHTNYCLSLKFSPDGTLLASGSRDGTAILWSTATWKPTRTFQNPDQRSDFKGPGMIESVAFSPDGKLLAVASRESSVHLWDILGTKPVQSLKGHSSAVNVVEFSPDGRTLASGGVDQTVRLWNVETGSELMQLDSGAIALGVITSLSFSPNGQHLLAGGNSAAIWSTLPVVWNDAENAADILRKLLRSDADFQSRIRMLSENLRLFAALEKIDSNEASVAAALAATQANWNASRQNWVESARAFDRLVTADPTTPASWLRTPGLLRVATALVHQNRLREAVMLLNGGAKRRTQDGLPPAVDRVGFGITYSADDGQVRVTDLLPGFSGSRSGLFPGDVIVKVNDTDITRESLKTFGELLKGEAGTKVRLTVRHASGTQPNELELVSEKYIHDVATGNILHPLLLALNERLAQQPRNALLLELRAELAGQWSDAKSQVADYTMAIEAVSGQTTEVAVADLQRLYCRRGNAHVALRKWPQAVDDFANGITDGTTDEDLLTGQAQALAQAIVMSTSQPVVWHFKKSESHGLELVTSAHDGNTQPASIEGQECLSTMASINDNSYAYFAIDEGYKHSRGLPVHVEIEYWSSGAGNLRVQYDSESGGAYASALESAPLVKSTEWKTARFTLTDARFANSQNGKADFRFHVLSNGRFYFKRVSAKHLLPGGEAGDPWVQLATVYRMNNESEALDKLVERHPRSSAAIGDLFAVDNEWRRAVEIYSRGIAVQSINVDLLSKRARAYEAIKDWEAASADWYRSANGNPVGADLLAEFARRLAAADKVSLATEQFKKAQALYEHSLEADPDNELVAAELAQLLLDRQEHENSDRWTVLEPTVMTSAGDATLTLLDDNSILASGKNPDRDVYTLIARPGLEHIAVIRLEALPHPTLPNEGPGRFPGNGNFYVNELRVISAGIPVNLPAIALDYNEFQESEQIIDGNVDGQAGWGNVARAGGKNKAIVTTDLYRSPDDELRIELHSPSPTRTAQHNLGHFRLSITDDQSVIETEAKRFATMNMVNPWAKLAAAYHLLGDQPTFDRMVKDHPAASGGLGELYALEKNWQRAVGEFSKAISPETKDPKLLAKRAEGYEKLKQWDLALLDWTRASQLQPDVAFERFKPNGAGSWQFDILHGGACSMVDVDGTLIFTTTAVTGVDWHIQTFQAPLQLENGAEYVIRFKMKSPDTCAVKLYARIHEDDWHSIGLEESIVPPSEFQDYEFTFVARDVVLGNNRIGFQLGNERGRVMVREIVILKKRDGETMQNIGFLVKRASDYVSRENWDLALHEWRRIVAQQPKLTQSAFDEFRKAQRWNEAAEFGLQLVKRNRTNALEWLRVAPILALADDQEAFSSFCGRMGERFADSTFRDAEILVKASLLRANAIELAKLPVDTFVKRLESGTEQGGFPSWAWGTRALWAYRNGDAEATLRYVEKSEEHRPTEPAHAFNLSLLAMAQHQLQKPEESRRILEEASQVINRLQADESKRDHDLLIAQIIFREAEVLITGKTTPDIVPLLKRASDYISQEKWELALAEWRRIVAQQPNLTQSAFDQFRKAQRWNEATEFGLQLVEQNRNDSLWWLRIAAVLTLAEDQAAYSDFCVRMLQQFAESKLHVDFERVVKVCLLRANAIELAILPVDKFTILLDNGTALEWFPPWGWGTRALLAYRSGDAASAIKYAEKSEEHKPADPTQAMNLVILAMSQHQLQHPEESRRALEAASQLIDRLKSDESKRDHDLLIAQILFREAETLINGKTKP